MAKTINLKIITHEKEVFNEEVNGIYSKSTEGEFGILPDHQPFMSALDIGVTKVEKDGQFEYFTTMGGIFQFKNNEAIILTEAAEQGSDIDIPRAQLAKERAEAKLNNATTQRDVKLANNALARAMARLKAASK